MAQRAYYHESISQFGLDTNDEILGRLAENHHFALEDLQKNAWIAQIQLLKQLAPQFPGSYIAFEFAIPRMGKRVDVVLLYNNLVFVLEFKVGEKAYPSHAIEQVLDYALDLKNFHEGSHNRTIIPILVATEARPQLFESLLFPDSIHTPLKANKHNLGNIINQVARQVGEPKELSPHDWFLAGYKPTPTIVQAAQALYKGHNVAEISRSDSGAINLSATSDAISKIIEVSKREGRKSICFITGVPGAGKTLAGLNIANEWHKTAEGQHAVFLSGNGPLVQVLQEALARDEVETQRALGSKLTKKEALSKTKVFIQNIHHFRDESLQSGEPPAERVAVFDEAQRAWNLDQTSSFMARKKGTLNFNMSEPEFLIQVMDRHQDWAVIVCLIGGGQEINTGEAGLVEWFHSIERSFPDWDVYVSDRLDDVEYTNGENILDLLHPDRLRINRDLHLSVSVRSFRSERLAEFVKAVLDSKPEHAKSLMGELQSTYPICVTRDLAKAKAWVLQKARGSEGKGLIASSGAYRLKPYGIHVKSMIDPPTWFLNDTADVRSAGFLEDVATEFDIQGLELDWTCVAWDANLRRTSDGWEPLSFKGTAWQRVNDLSRARYLINSYRVLLTRARQGMVIFVPRGDDDDHTRQASFYDPIFDYLRECGIPELGFKGDL